MHILSMDFVANQWQSFLQLKLVHNFVSEATSLLVSLFFSFHKYSSLTKEVRKNVSKSSFCHTLRVMGKCSGEWWQWLDLHWILSKKQQLLFFFWDIIPGITINNHFLIWPWVWAHKNFENVKKHWMEYSHEGGSTPLLSRHCKAVTVSLKERESQYLLELQSSIMALWNISATADLVALFPLIYTILVRLSMQTPDSWASIWSFTLKNQTIKFFVACVYAPYSKMEINNPGIVLKTITSMVRVNTYVGQHPFSSVEEHWEELLPLATSP